MKACFWGTRGSLPAAADTLSLRQKIIEIINSSQGKQLSSREDIAQFVHSQFPFSQSGFYGTNTPCVEITGGEEYVICDAGSGIQDLSHHITTDNEGRSRTFNIFLSHLHWDHIQGFPFFMPRYIPAIRSWYTGDIQILRQPLLIKEVVQYLASGPGTYQVLNPCTRPEL